MPTFPASVVPRAKITVMALQPVPSVKPFSVVAVPSADVAVELAAGGAAALIAAGCASEGGNAFMEVQTARRARRDVEVCILGILGKKTMIEERSN